VVCTPLLDVAINTATSAFDVAVALCIYRRALYLQLCEWHAIQAIKRRLVAARRYKKERREEIIDKINAWVKADIDNLDEKWNKLLKELYKVEQEYIYKNY
jgi:hypothetical protein